MAPFEPLANVYYRLQNADFGTFVELRTVVGPKGELVMRPQKDGLQQQWTFKYIADQNRYEIQTGSPGSKPYYLGIDKGLATSTRTAPAKAWSVSGIQNNAEHFIFRSIGTGQNGANQLLYLDNQANLRLLDEDEDVDYDQNPPVNVRWRIREVLPSVPKDVMLPKDTYRIRTFNGIMIQMASNNDFVTLGIQGKGTFQGWVVEPQGNGKCTIRNSAEKSAYLGTRAENQSTFVAVRKVSTPDVWELTSIGSGYMYTIGTTMKTDTGTLRLAVSVGDKNDIILKPSKFAHNQIWLFEPTDGTDNSLPVVDGGVPPPPYETRYAEIPPKNYYIRNTGYGSNWIFVASGPWRLYPSTSQSYQFLLTYKSATSARFELAYSTSAQSFVISNNTLVIDNNNATEWVLERSTSNSTQYYICVAADTNRVLSGDTTKDLNGYDRYRIDIKEANKPTQLWTFT